jgi:CRP/FNR family transcriptional regulator
MLLRMTRADLGNFLALQLETVVRALYRLQAQGLIEVDRREIRILDPTRLRAQLSITAVH